jgi:acyl-CoA synthetase (AMP-forming)/AMP-acid ligase II
VVAAPVLSLSEGLAGQARQRPDHVALVHGEERLTYAALNRRVDAAAHCLWALGVRPGDRVATLLPNGVPAVELLFAAARAGAVVVPLNPRSTAAELEHILTDTGPRVVIGVPPALDAARQALPAGARWVAEGEPAGDAPGYAALRDAHAARGAFPDQGGEASPWLIVYTSGTTGRPKGALRNQRSDYLMGLMLAPAVGVGPGDVGMVLLPLYHVNSIWVVTLSICVGATCHLSTALRFQPSTMLAELERSGATYAMFVPTMLGYLAEGVERGEVGCGRLRVLMTSSAPLPIPVRDRLLAALPQARMVELYGATELGAVTLAWHDAGAPGGTIGFPLPGVRVRLLDAQRRPVAPGEPGELFVDSPLLMDNYFGRPEETEGIRAGTYVGVGDLARQDADGRLYLVDRVTDTIITSGENVYPTEVEGALLSHPAVALAAVVGVPDERRGEAVVAVVVCREGQTVAAAELGAHCRARLAPYKCPRSIAFARELPLGLTGKVLRRKVREAWAQGAYRAAGSGA